MSEAGFTHLGPDGRPRMVDVGEKPATHRVAVAEGRLRTRPETLAAIRAGATPKGDVLAVAQLAGIMAAKRTAELIPLCHPLALSAVDVTVEGDPALPGVVARATVRVEGRTGVEMEALTAVSVALLTVYDMCKATDRDMTVTEVRLLRKEGGRSGSWEVSAQPGVDR
ncbi:MAG: cyclic pyranopterin monophosphate synthase MoaC [Gemmatimonadota bacterium]|jgi:cyclic pyranopterin phosphate synthase|nr:cyclic pyranopterin monophosphate synthase MoaC [Gemmatimonadota bacterium]